MKGPRIDHVVVLMLENRSFDHMLAFWPIPRQLEVLAELVSS